MRLSPEIPVPQIVPMCFREFKQKKKPEMSYLKLQIIRLYVGSIIFRGVSRRMGRSFCPIYSVDAQICKAFVILSVLNCFKKV